MGNLLEYGTFVTKSRAQSITRVTRLSVFSIAVILLLVIFNHSCNSYSWISIPWVKHQPGINLGRLGAIASESSTCSRIGIDILQRGGNAADAIVATTLCTGVIAMYHSGIGGGGFAVIRSSEGSYETIDFREAAPRSASQDMYRGHPEDSILGGLASGVPGELRGLEYIHQKYGSMPWKSLVEPAVNVARYGFRVTEDLERCMQTALSENPDDVDFFTHDPSWSMDFAPNGTRLKVGDIMYRKRYADTLELIAVHGADIVYRGAIAESLLQTVRANNGTLTLEDLQQYSVRRLPTSNITYHGYRLFSTTAPSSGAVALSTLKIVEGYDKFFDLDTLNISSHRLVEAMKFAYGQRARLGDPYFVPGLDQYQEEMLNETTASLNMAKISDQHTLNMSMYNPEGYEPSASHGTSHLASTDKSGLSVSLTTTVNLLFGSRLMVPETGIILNDVMNDFSIPGTSNEFGYAPSPANFIRPLKRALSSTAPVFVETADGTLCTVLGAAGGSRIISSMVQNLVHILHQNMSMADALAQPRFHHQLIPDELGLEPEYDEEVISFLEQRGHNATWMPTTLSAAQGIIRLPNGTFDAAGEPRQSNSAGYSV